MLEPSQFCYHYGITARNTPYSACLELGHDTKSYTGWLAGEGYWVEQAEELKEADSTGTVRHLAIVPVLIRRATSVFTIPVGNAASERTFNYNYVGAFLTPQHANVSPAFLAAYLTFCCDKKVVAAAAEEHGRELQEQDKKEGTKRSCVRTLATPAGRGGNGQW